MLTRSAFLRLSRNREVNPSQRSGAMERRSTEMRHLSPSSMAWCCHFLMGLSRALAADLRYLFVSLATVG